MLGFLARNGLRRGLLGGNRTWLAVGIVAGGFRWISRMVSRDEEVVAREVLEPGQTLVVDHTGIRFGELPRKQRR